MLLIWSKVAWLYSSLVLAVIGLGEILRLILVWSPILGKIFAQLLKWKHSLLSKGCRLTL